MAIIRDGTNQQIENFKAALGIRGDVYVDIHNHIASLESHRVLMAMYSYPSTATTIEEAEVERLAFDEWLEEQRKGDDPEPEEDFTEETGGEE